MKAAILPTYRFYQGPYLVQRLVGDQCQRVMRNIDQPLVLIQDQRSLALECDMQGSTHVAGGQHIKGYSPYGHRLVTDTALIAYTGEWFEPLLSGYMLGNGYRTYSTALMRFQAPDNLSPFGEGGLNAYCYCSGDPINHSDPSGHMFRSRGSSSIRPRPKAQVQSVHTSGLSIQQGVVQKTTSPLQLTSPSKAPKTPKTPSYSLEELQAERELHYRAIDNLDDEIYVRMNTDPQLTGKLYELRLMAQESIRSIDRMIITRPGQKSALSGHGSEPSTLADLVTNTRQNVNT